MGARSGRGVSGKKLTDSRFKTPRLKSSWRSCPLTVQWHRTLCWRRCSWFAFIWRPSISRSCSPGVVPNGALKIQTQIAYVHIVLSRGLSPGGALKIRTTCSAMHSLTLPQTMRSNLQKKSYPNIALWRCQKFNRRKSSERPPDYFLSDAFNSDFVPSSRLVAWRFALSHVRKNFGEEVVEPLMQEPERC